MESIYPAGWNQLFGPGARCTGWPAELAVELGQQGRTGILDGNEKALRAYQASDRTSERVAPHFEKVGLRIRNLMADRLIRGNEYIGCSIDGDA